jgi:hypothetical protein
MTWFRLWQMFTALLCLWVLAGHASPDFKRVRIRLVTTPLATQPTVSLPLAEAAAIPERYLVLICRVRNVGTEPVRISARLADEILQERAVAPGSSARLDLVWRRPAFVPESYRIDLAGTTSQWTVEYAELANVHGFTRGIVEFLILPAGQPFAPAAPWTLLALAAWALLVSTRPPAPWPRWLKLAHLVLSIAVVMLFLLAALSAMVSSFRVVLALHTFILGCFVLWAPPTLAVLEQCRVLAARGAARMLRLAPDPASLRSAAAMVPWFHMTVGTAVAAYAVVLWVHVGAYAGGADSSGYLNSARLLAEGRVSTPMRAVPSFPPDKMPRFAYRPLGFNVADKDTLVPTYPVGLPLTIMTIAQLTGWEAAADVTMVLHALLGLALIFWLARECGLSSHISALASLLLATSPLYVYISLTLMSDTPALVWTTAAVLLAWRSREDGRWAVLAGAALSLAILTRPTNILALAPIAICLGVSLPRWLWLSAGGAPGAVMLVRYNIAAYGSVVATGYENTGLLFAVGNVGPSLWNYVQWLPVVLTPVGLLALGLPALVRRAPRLVTVLLLWIATYFIFYMFYAYTRETWWYLRFLLPAFPPLIVGSLWVGRTLRERWSSRLRFAAFIRGAPAALILVGLVLWHNVWWSQRLYVYNMGRDEKVYRQAAEWTIAHLPPDAAILAMQVSGAFRYYTNFPILRYEFLDGDAFQRLIGDAAAGRLRLYAVLFPYEITERGFFTRIRGHWEKVATIEHITVWHFTEESREARGDLKSSSYPHW